MKVSELTFEPHPVGTGERALATFDNGYSASVLRGAGWYTAGDTYEVAVLYAGQLDYTTPITDDVLGYLPEEDANEALAAIEALPKKDSANGHKTENNQAD